MAWGKERVLQAVYSGKITRHMYALYFLPWMTLTANRPLGRHVYDHDWDALIVLDACRVDALQEVAPEFDFIEEVGAVPSVGSTSKEWIANTFTEEYEEAIRNTACITANSWVDTVLTDDADWGFWTATKGSFLESHDIFADLMARDVARQDDFLRFESIGHLESRESFNITPAEDVTNYAISVGRDSNFDRMVVHYMQPHAPFIANASEDGEVEQWEERPFKALRNGESHDKVWNGYLDNLRYVLENVGTLLENLNAEDVIITADHGELFGEFGLYEHIGGVLHPNLRKVPWVRTTATDRKTHEPNLADTDSDSSVEKRLADLGYL